MLFLGLASNYSAKDILSHALTLGSDKDYQTLEEVFARKYGTQEESTKPTKNRDKSSLSPYTDALDRTSIVYSGRTAIFLALEAMKSTKKVKNGDHVLVNGFTCKAVVEAIQKAGLVPVFAEVEKFSPDYTPETLESLLKKDKKIKIFIIQNSFGIPVDVIKFEKIKKKHGLFMLEDLAHCAGRKYSDGREIGTVGDATCLSFGKGKALDVINGGAVILRNPSLSFPDSFKKENLKKPKIADSMRAGWYPVFGAIARGLAHVHLEKPFLALLLKFRWIERSADTRLDPTRTITNWQAKLILKKLKNLKNSPLREIYFVKNREICLEELKKHGFRLEELWYDTPVAPKRYYKSVKFPEKSHKNSIFVANSIINLPTWYSDKKHKKELALARKIIKKYEIKD